MAKGTEKSAETPKTTESVYKIEEFKAASVKVFGVMPECVEAAFKAAGKTAATLDEAKKIVNKFMTKEIPARSAAEGSNNSRRRFW